MFALVYQPSCKEFRFPRYLKFLLPIVLCNGSCQLRQALEGEGAVLKNRDLMGATNPKDAAAGTIRADFAESIDANAVHGSDSEENAAIEIAYFFGK